MYDNYYLGKAISITCSERVFVALGIQHAIRKGLIVMSGGLFGVTVFSHISHKGHGFRKKILIEHKMCFLIFSTTFVRNLSHSKKN